MTQCSKMYYFLGKLEAIHTRLFVQRNLLQPFSKMSYAVDEIDDPPVLKGTAADLHYASLTATGNLPEPGDDSFVAVVDVNGPILVFPSIDYNLWIDLDDNPQTGDPSGFDALVKLSSSSPTLGMLRVFSLPNSLLVYQSSADVEATSLDWTGPYSEEEASIGTSLSGQVPKTVLASIRNIATEVAFVATTDNGVASDMVGPKRLETDFADVPALSLSPDHTFPSSGIGVMGVRFSANVHYVLLFNDQEVASGTTTSLGQLSETVVVPSITPGDYVVEVITDDGAAALCLLRVGGTSVPAVSGLGIAMMSIALFAYGVWRVRRSEVGQR